MEIMEIIKEAFIFPSKNLDKLAIYIALSFVIGILVAGGLVSGVFGILNNTIYIIITAILFIIAIVLGFIITGYQVSIVKSGINKDEDAPGFDWVNDLVTGIKMFIVEIVYYIIPFIIVAIVAWAVDVPGHLMNIFEQAGINPQNLTAMATNNTVPVFRIPDAAIASFGASIAIVALVAFVLLVIFLFLLTMAEARLANTGSLAEALNIFEAFKDIERIGYGKVIAVVILAVAINVVITAILSFVYGKIPQLSFLSMIVTPYIMFFAQRATGLLYSDIA